MERERQSRRGFAAMDPKELREVARRGGRAAHERGRAHEFTSEEAREAGRRGGRAAHQSGKAHEFSSEEARRAGRLGGQARWARWAREKAAKAAAEAGGTTGADAAKSQEDVATAKHSVDVSDEKDLELSESERTLEPKSS